MVAGEFIYLHQSGTGVVYGAQTIVGSYSWKAISTAGAGGTSAPTAASLACATTADITENHMSLSESGATVAWPCYMALSGTPIPTTTQRGINYFTVAGTISNLPMTALAYANGVMRSAVADDLGGFYVRGLGRLAAGAWQLGPRHPLRARRSPARRRRSSPTSTLAAPRRSSSP